MTTAAILVWWGKSMSYSWLLWVPKICKPNVKTKLLLTTLFFIFPPFLPPFPPTPFLSFYFFLLMASLIMFLYILSIFKNRIWHNRINTKSAGNTAIFLLWFRRNESLRTAELPPNHNYIVDALHIISPSLGPAPSETCYKYLTLSHLSKLTDPRVDPWHTSVSLSWTVEKIKLRFTKFLSNCDGSPLEEREGTP